MQTLQANANTSNKKIIIGILLLLGLFILSIFSSLALKPLGISLTYIFFVSRLCIWGSVALMIWYAHSVEKTKLLLWQETKHNFIFYVVAVISIFLILAVGSNIITYLLSHFFHFSNDSAKLNAMLIIFKENKWLLYFTVITAGITEELLFRGYLMPRIEQLTKSSFWAIIISSLLFGLSHWGFGTVMQVIGPVFIGIIFAIFYYKYRNLKTLMIFHALWDLVQLLVAIHMLH